MHIRVREEDDLIRIDAALEFHSISGQASKDALLSGSAEQLHEHLHGNDKEQWGEGVSLPHSSTVSDWRPWLPIQQDI